MAFYSESIASARLFVYQVVSQLLPRLLGQGEKGVGARIMNTDISFLRKALLEIMADSVQRSTEQIISEISAEYPQFIQSVQNSWIKENGLSCGAFQHPSTLIQQTLECLANEGKIVKSKQPNFWTIT